MLAHEVGHLVGYEHEHDGVMQEALSAGERLTLHRDTPDPVWSFIGLTDVTKKRDRFAWWL